MEYGVCHQYQKIEKPKDKYSLLVLIQLYGAMIAHLTSDQDMESILLIFILQYMIYTNCNANRVKTIAFIKYSFRYYRMKCKIFLQKKTNQSIFPFIESMILFSKKPIQMQFQNMITSENFTILRILQTQKFMVIRWYQGYTNIIFKPSFNNFLLVNKDVYMVVLEQILLRLVNFGRFYLISFIRCCMQFALVRPCTFSY